MRFGIVVALMAAVGLLPAFASADPIGEATFYKSGLSASALIRNLTPGPDGNVWFVNSYGQPKPAVGKITPAGAITEYVSGTNLSGLNAGSKLNTIVAGPGGSKYLWVTDWGTTPAIARIDSASPETAVEFSIGKAGSKPVGIAVGPEGNLWFADASETSPAIGVAVLKAGNEIEKIEEFPLTLNPNSKPLGIVAGSDGNLWFTDQGKTPAIGKINPSNQAIEEFATGVNSEPGGEFPDFGPYGLLAGPDGNVWFAEPGNNEANGQGLCRILTSGEVGKFSCFKEGLIASSNPAALTVAPGGELWYSDASGVKETQLLEISATENLGGTYKLSFEGQETGWTGSGNTSAGGAGTGDVVRYPKEGTLNCTSTNGSKELKSCGAELLEKAEVGMRITKTGLPAKTMIEKVEGGIIYTTLAATATSTVSTTEGWIKNVSTTGGEFKVGQLLTSSSGSPSNSEIIAIAGSTITTAAVPTAAGIKTGATLEAGSKTVSSVTTSTGCPAKGEEIAGEGIQAGTTIATEPSSCEPTSLTLSKVTIKAGTGVSLSANLPYNASASAIEGALAKLPATKEGAGVNDLGASPVKREITFGGLRQNADVEQIACNGAGLTGTSPSCTVTTTKPGVPNAVGCMTTAGKACGRFPFAELFGGPGGITYMPGGNVWLTSGAASSATLGKVGVEPIGPTNRRTITLTKTPAGNVGSGLGSVSSKPKGIKCAQTCNEAVGRFFKEQAVVLTEAPSGELSSFKEWNNVGEPSGVCDGSTSTTCTIPADSNDYEIEAVFKGSSKAFTPAEALTLSKGESELNRGWGTVKAAGLTCEAECDETTALYQGPVELPKPKAGKLVELKALPAFGSEFVGWSGGGCSGKALVCKVTMETAMTVTAEFADLPDFALAVEKEYKGGLGSVMSKPKGINCGTTCTSTQADMPEGSSILLTAKPATTEPPTSFVKWEGGDCEGLVTTTCTVGMDKAETVKAVFSGTVKAIVNQKSLTLTKEGTGIGTVKAAGLTCEVLCTAATSLYYGPVTLPKAKAGAKVILKATTAPGSTAVSWSGCKVLGNPNECEVVMGETNAEVTATFDELK